MGACVSGLSQLLQSDYAAATALQALHHAEEKYRSIFENAIEGIFQTSPDGKYLTVNPALARMYGYASPEELIETLSDIEHQLYVDQARRAEFVALMEKDGSVSNFEAQVYRYDKSIIWISEHARAVRSERGELLYYEGTVENITQRKNAEQALRESEQRYSSLLEVCPDAICVIREEKFVFLNKAAVRLFGAQQPSDLLGKSPFDFIPPEFHAQVKENFMRHLNQREGAPRLEQKILRLDGKPVAVEIAAAPVVDQGVISIQAVLRDITERRHLEERLRQARKLEAIGQLAGGIAHDFNNLLTVINGRADLILATLARGDPLRAKIELISKTGERAAKLTCQLLAYSRRQVLQPKILNLNAVVSDMNNLLQRLIREDIHLRAVLDPKLYATKADPGQIEQVLMNLVVNARDAMPKGGELTIETANAELDDLYCLQHAEVTPGNYVLLAIEDTGCGMDEATQEHLFEPFFTTKESGKGTGLGLATVYGIVRQSGGHVGVRSEVGRGTRFEVFLPAYDSSDRMSGSSPLLQAVKRGMETILVVEDEAPVRDLTCEILELSGYTVITRENGVEALKYCEENGDTIDLVMTDSVMPEMSGPELAERLALSHPHIKLLLMSGYTDQGVNEHGEATVENFIQKPFSPLLLARKVREILDKKVT